MKKRLTIIFSSIGGGLVAIIGIILVTIISLILLIVLPKVFQYNKAKEISKNSNFEYELLYKLGGSDYVIPEGYELVNDGMGTYSIANSKYFDNGELKEDFIVYKISSWPYFMGNQIITAVECWDENYKVYGVGINTLMDEWDKTMDEHGFKKTYDSGFYRKYESNFIRIQVSYDSNNNVSKKYAIYIDPPVLLIKLIGDTVELV